MKKLLKSFVIPILKKLEKNNCKIYGDRFLNKNYKGKISIAKEKDWSTEYSSCNSICKNCKKLSGSNQSY